MTISLTAFAGTQPKQAARKLSAGASVKATNTRLTDGSLRAWRGAASVHQFPSAMASFVLHDGTWEGFSTATSFVAGPTATDRLYIAGANTAPQVRVGANTYPLKLEAPTVAPSIATIGTPDEAVAVKVGYVYTWLTGLDEESSPSPLSNTLLTSPATEIQISNIPAAPNSRGITKLRLYRSQTDVTGVTSLFFVKELPLPLTTFNHLLATDPLQEEINTIAYDPAPDGMEGLIALPNGIMAAFDGRELLFSEPYKPHAWPEAYRLFTDYEIVGLAAFGSMIAVMTTGTPYRVQGTHPDNMVMEQIEQDAPCVSQLGIVDMGYAAAYPSTDGLMLITAQGAQLVTGAVFSPEEWQELEPTTFKAARHEGQYLYSNLSGVTRTMGVIDVSGNNPHHCVVELEADALWHDLLTGHTYFLDNASNVRRFHDDDTPLLQYTWKSSELTSPAPLNYGAFMVDSDPEDGEAVGQTVCTFFADGVQRHQVTVDAFKAIRLPSGFIARRWQIQLSGTQRVTAVRMAQTMEQLLQVPNG